MATLGAGGLRPVNVLPGSGTSQHVVNLEETKEVMVMVLRTSNSSVSYCRFKGPKFTSRKEAGLIAPNVRSNKELGTGKSPERELEAVP